MVWFLCVSPLNCDKETKPSTIVIVRVTGTIKVSAENLLSSLRIYFIAEVLNWNNFQIYGNFTFLGFFQKYFLLNLWNSAKRILCNWFSWLLFAVNVKDLFLSFSYCFPSHSISHFLSLHHLGVVGCHMRQFWRFSDGLDSCGRRLSSLFNIYILYILCIFLLCGFFCDLRD